MYAVEMVFRSGRHCAGLVEGRMPTIQDVTAQAGVSPATVSRVLNGEDEARYARVRSFERAASAVLEPLM